MKAYTSALILTISLMSSGCIMRDGGPTISYPPRESGVSVSFGMKLINAAGEPVEVQVDDHPWFTLVHRRDMMLARESHTIRVKFPNPQTQAQDVDLLMYNPAEITINDPQKAAKEGKKCLEFDSFPRGGDVQLYSRHSETKTHQVVLLNGSLAHAIVTVDDYPSFRMRPMGVSYMTVPEGRRKLQVILTAGTYGDRSEKLNGEVNVDTWYKISIDLADGQFRLICEPRPDYEKKNAN